MQIPRIDTLLPINYEGFEQSPQVLAPPGHI